MFASILEQNLQLVLCVVLNAFRHADAARNCNSFQTHRHVHTIAEYVPAIDDDIANVYPNAKFDPLFLRYVGISLSHATLDFDRTANCIDDAIEICKHSVAS